MSRFHVMVECVCGTVKRASINSIIDGNTVSCGCYIKQKTSQRSRKHWYKGTPVYLCWRNMKERCGNPKNSHYARYGGRGIRVCDSWQKFEDFLADMGEPPTGHTIERKNNNGNYEPGNCVWLPSEKQAWNRSTTIVVELNGERMPFCVAAERLGIGYAKLRSLFERNELPPGLAVVSGCPRRKSDAA